MFLPCPRAWRGSPVHWFPLRCWNQGQGSSRFSHRAVNDRKHKMLGCVYDRFDAHLENASFSLCFGLPSTDAVRVLWKYEGNVSSRSLCRAVYYSSCLLLLKIHFVFTHYLLRIIFFLIWLILLNLDLAFRISLLHCHQYERLAIHSFYLFIYFHLIKTQTAFNILLTVILRRTKFIQNFISQK